jgi:hypothetical protein
MLRDGDRFKMTSGDEAGREGTLQGEALAPMLDSIVLPVLTMEDPVVGDGMVHAQGTVSGAYVQLAYTVDGGGEQQALAASADGLWAILLRGLAPGRHVVTVMALGVDFEVLATAGKVFEVPVVMVKPELTLGVPLVGAVGEKGKAVVSVPWDANTPGLAVSWRVVTGTANTVLEGALEGLAVPPGVLAVELPPGDFTMFVSVSNGAGADTDPVSFSIDEPEEPEEPVVRYPAWPGRVGGPRAPFNIPVVEFGVHPENVKYRDRFWSTGADRPGNVNASRDEYTYPVVSVLDATTTIVVRSANGNVNGKTIPWNPAWRASRGTDAQLIIVNPTDRPVRGLHAFGEINLWQIRQGSNPLQVSNGSIIPGSYRDRVDPWKPSRGIGRAYLEMLVMAEELKAGFVPHALSMPVKNPDTTVAWWPAGKLERRTGVVGNPEGLRWYLKGITESVITGWLARFPNEPKLRAALRAIAVALSDSRSEGFGCFLTDTSGAATIQLEDVVTGLPVYREIGWLGASGGSRTDSQGKRIPEDILDGLVTRDRIVVAAEGGPRVTAL